MIRFRKQWETFWKGHHIIVTNWWDLFLRVGEELVIDGGKVDEHRGWLSVSQDLSGTIYSNGVENKVRAHIGSIDGGLRTGCLIFVGEELVGGDVEKEFVT